MGKLVSLLYLVTLWQLSHSQEANPFLPPEAATTEEINVATKTILENAEEAVEQLLETADEDDDNMIADLDNLENLLKADEDAKGRKKTDDGPDVDAAVVEGLQQDAAGEHVEVVQETLENLSDAGEDLMEAFLGDDLEFSADS